MNFEFDNNSDQLDSQWYAVYVKYKCEKLVANLLTRKGIKAYVPLKTVFRIKGKQKRRVLLPLISSYVFVKISKNEYVTVLETNKVLNFVKFANSLISIPEREIDILKRVVGDIQLNVLAHPTQINKGDKVRIVSGSLAGLNGELKDIRGNQQVLIELHHIGYNLLITTKKEMVAPVSLLE